METHFQSAAARGADRPDRRDRTRGRRGPGGGQHFRHAAVDAAAGTGRALQRPQRHQVPGRPRRRAGRRGGYRSRSTLEALRALSRTIGPVLGPFESYLTMRGIKTFPLRMERQCANACRVASWLATHPARGAGLLHGRSGASRRGHHPPPVPAESVRRHGELRNPRRGQGRRLPLHGSPADDRARHFAGRRPHHDAVSGDEFAPRALAQAPRAHGHSATTWCASRWASKRPKTSSRTWSRRWK